MGSVRQCCTGCGTRGLGLFVARSMYLNYLVRGVAPCQRISSSIHAGPLNQPTIEREVRLADAAPQVRRTLKTGLPETLPASPSL